MDYLVYATCLYVVQKMKNLYMENVMKNVMPVNFWREKENYVDGREVGTAQRTRFLLKENYSSSCGVLPSPVF